MGQLTPYPMGALNGSLRENVVQFPFAGASPTLFELTKYLAETAQVMTTAAYQVEANQGEAASLYLARLQQGLKTPNMIVMRVYERAKAEFQKIALLNYKHFDNDYYNKVLDEAEQFSMEIDFNPDDCDVKLVADPSQGSDIERVGKAEDAYRMAMEQAAAGQQVMNLRGAVITKLKAQGFKDEDIAMLAPEPDPNAPPPKEVQIALAQQAFEAELQQQELQLRKQEFELKKVEVAQKQEQIRLNGLKQAHEAAKALSELGLKADLDEATITQKYASALAQVCKETGMSFDEAKQAVMRLESEVINDNGGTNGAIQTGLTGTGGPLA